MRPFGVLAMRSASEPEAPTRRSHERSSPPVSSDPSGSTTCACHLRVRDGGGADHVLGAGNAGQQIAREGRGREVHELVAVVGDLGHEGGEQRHGDGGGLERGVHGREFGADRTHMSGARFQQAFDLMPGVAAVLARVGEASSGVDVNDAVGPWRCTARLTGAQAQALAAQIRACQRLIDELPEETTTVAEQLEALQQITAAVEEKRSVASHHRTRRPTRHRRMLAQFSELPVLRDEGL